MFWTVMTFWNDFRMLVQRSNWTLVLVLTPPADISNRSCNCMNKTNCPVNQNCLATNPIYEATINANLPNNQEKKYIGLCDSTLKKRFANHKSSFNHKRYKNSTSLSVELWKIKEENGTPTVTWRIIRKANAYTPESKHCLCLNEKYEITNFLGKNLLNKRMEIIQHLLLLTSHKIYGVKNEDTPV